VDFCNLPNHQNKNSMPKSQKRLAQKDIVLHFTGFALPVNRIALVQLL